MTELDGRRAARVEGGPRLGHCGCDLLSGAAEGALPVAERGAVRRPAVGVGVGTRIVEVGDGGLNVVEAAANVKELIVEREKHGYFGAHRVDSVNPAAGSKRVGRRAGTDAGERAE